MLGTSDVWLTIHLSQQTSEPAYYILDWRISRPFHFGNFCAVQYIALIHYLKFAFRAQTEMWNTLKWKKFKKTRKPTFHSPLNQCFSPSHFFNFDTIFPATRLDSILLGFEASFACKEPFRPKRVIIPCQEQMRSLSFMPEPFSWQRILRKYPCRLPLLLHDFFLATK